ncbi:MAG: hypothetical protein HRT72_00445 [Flavobacteriales bacterium]|nr:hypothetical protein [Flavobacteriales bacterium]
MDNTEINSTSKKDGVRLILRDDNVVDIRLKDRHIVTLEDLHGMRDMFDDFTKHGEYLPVIAVVGKGMSMTKEARHTDIFAENDFKITKLAIVISSFFPKLLSNWYFKYVTQPKYEYRFFEKDSDAEDWLKEPVRIAK